MIPLIGIFGIFAWVIFMVSVKSENTIIGFFSAMLFLIFGAFVVMSGMDTTNNLMTQALGVTHIGLGMYVMFMSAYEEVTE